MTPGTAGDDVTDKITRCISSDVSRNAVTGDTSANIGRSCIHNTVTGGASGNTTTSYIRNTVRGLPIEEFWRRVPIESRYPHQDWHKESYDREMELHGCPYGSHKNTCVWCGRIFYSSHPAKYCSYYCVNDASIERQKERRAKRLKKNCASCGIEFTVKRSDALYCSSACKQRAYRLHKAGGAP
jgi:hypothetical protein